MCINNYYNYEILDLGKKKLKNYFILNFLVHCISYPLVYGDESQLMVNHIYYGFNPMS